DVIWERTDRDLRYRSAMDLGCNPNVVELTMVQRQGKFPTSVHAIGCGNQALYSRQLRRSKGRYTDRNSTWVREAQGPFTAPVETVRPRRTITPPIATTSTDGECAPLPAVTRGCKYSHYRGFMKYDAERVYLACDGQERVDVTDTLPPGT